jgi:hypothetical protein
MLLEKASQEIAHHPNLTSPYRVGASEVCLIDKLFEEVTERDTVTFRWLLQFAQPETVHLLNTGSQPANTTKEPAMEERSILEMRR